MNYYVTCDVTKGYECYLGPPTGHQTARPFLLSFAEAELLVFRHLQSMNHTKHPRIYQEDGILIQGPAVDKNSMEHHRLLNAPARPETEPE